MTVAVVGFPGLGWAEIAAGIRTAAVSQTFSAVCFIVFLLNFVARQASFTRQCPDAHLDPLGTQIIGAPGKRHGCRWRAPPALRARRNGRPPSCRSSGGCSDTCVPPRPAADAGS